MPSVFTLERAANRDKTLQMSLRSNINLLSREKSRWRESGREMVMVEALESGFRRLILLPSTDATAD